MNLKSILSTYKVLWDRPIDISIPLRFNAEQPNFFGAPHAASQPLRAGGFIGDTRQGGSCNVYQYSLISHCNGTHTECVGHIVNQSISIQQILKEAFIPATLITIQPERASDSPDTYVPEKQAEDLMITKGQIRNALRNADEEFLSALIIRDLPNDTSKMSRDYSRHPAPFFSIEAMKQILESGVNHLIVDIPSVDRANDEGKMSCHHLFWGVEMGSKDIDPNTTSRKTITEMVYIPDSVEDGEYLVNIQIPPFVSDAAPSRPLLFKIEESQ